MQTRGRVNNGVAVYCLEHELHYLALHFEAGHVAIVGHDGDGFLDARREEVLVEDCCYGRLLG